MRKSSRICHSKLVVNRETRCSTSTGTRSYGHVHLRNDGRSCSFGKRLPGQFTFHQKHERKEIKQSQRLRSSNMSQKLISQQDEVTGISTTNWCACPLDLATLLNDRPVQLSTAKVHVFSDSVLRLGKIHQHSEAINAWKSKIAWFTNSLEYRKLHQMG